MLNIWVAPPDTDELAEQGIHMWERVHPDVSMVAFNYGRFAEVAAKLGKDLTSDVGLPSFVLRGFGKKGLPIMTCGVEAYAYVGGPCGEGDGGHVHEDWAIVQAVDPATGRDVPDGEWGNLVVTTLDRDNGLLRYDLEEAACFVTEPCAVRRDDEARLLGRPVQGPAVEPGQALPGQRARGRACARSQPVNDPTLEWQVVKPADDAAPLRVRVELGADGGDAAVIAGALRRRHRRRGRGRGRRRGRRAGLARTPRLQAGPPRRPLTGPCEILACGKSGSGARQSRPRGGVP